MSRIVCLVMTVAAVGVSAEERVKAPAIVSAAEWGSKPQPIAPERRHVSKYITIHHAGVVWKAGDDPVKKLQALQVYGQREKKWPDLPYHFLIAPDGRIFAGRQVEYEPDTNTSYKVSGHIGVELFGDFEKQRPSREQVESLVKLVAWLAVEYRIDMKDIGGHRDRAETDCPGRDLYRYFQDGKLKAWIKTAMEGGEAKVALGEAMKDGPTEVIPMK